jgi:hypothetical protein
VFISCTLLSKGQNGNREFDLFANRQDSLFMKAYEHRDVNSYKKLLDEFLAKYTVLAPNDKKTYSRYYYVAYYNLCCTWSLLNNKPLALESLDKAIKCGYYNYAHILEDSDLNNIRHEQEFKKMIAPLRETGDYLYILKKAAKYNLNDARELPPFTYQAANNPGLVALREAFHLDSIAGKGNEVSRILNLLHWIHNLIPHDGNHENPVVKNAMSMIAECKRDKRGLNCRGLATVLNECYLAMGISSRFVTCLPKDSLGIDNDCHVINMVYANSLKKWLWIDPTFDAYIMNEKGELLSIEEVRERIINDQPLLLNPEANWNHQDSETKEYYLYYYMAKNLYMLECHANSEYDAETRGQGKTETYIRLLPMDYFKQGQDKSEYDNKDVKTVFINYKTNNPDRFWVAPGK